MKFLFILTPLLFMGVSLVAAPCGNSTLQGYIGLGATGCSFGAVTFSAFQLVPGQTGATPVAATGVTVAPGGSTYNPMLTFGFTNPAATSAQLLESIFRFTISGSPLTGASLGLAGSATGDGLVTNVLNVCPNGRFAGNSPGGCPNTEGGAITFVNAVDRQLTDSTGPLLASFFDVFVDITLDGGPSGTATLNAATLSVTATPEPSAGLLMAVSLAALAGINARRKS